jgi:peptide/nickel transport system substrate-binding protein
VKRPAFLAGSAAALAAACAPAREVDTSRIGVALAGDPPTLNLLLGDDANVFDVGFLINSFLLRTDASGRLIPDLALEVPTLANGGISPDGRTLRYRLRTDARWHDGKPVTADDVVFSLRLPMRSDIDVADRSGYREIADARALSPHVVEVRLARAYAPAVQTLLATSANQPYPVLPRHLLGAARDVQHADFGSAPIGCGPYRLAAWQRGEGVRLERYDRYFRGTPPTRRIDCVVVPSNDALVAAWQDGAIDLAGLTGERDLADRLRARADADVRIYPRNTFAYLLFQHDRPALADPRVRRALVAAIDRRATMRKTFGPFFVDVVGDRLPGTVGFVPALPQQSYDPAQARRLLDDAGWTQRDDGRVRDGVPLELTLAADTSTFSQRLAVQVQEALGRCSVRATIRTYAGSVLNAPASQRGILRAGEFDLFIGSWNPGGVDDTSYLYRCDERPPNGENFGRICDPAVDRAAATVLGANDPVVRARDLARMQHALVERTHLAYLGFIAGGIVTRRGLLGVEPSRIVRSYWNCWEWRWDGTSR